MDSWADFLQRDHWDQFALAIHILTPRLYPRPQSCTFSTVLLYLHLQEPWTFPLCKSAQLHSPAPFTSYKIGAFLLPTSLLLGCFGFQDNLRTQTACLNMLMVWLGFIFERLQKFCCSPQNGNSKALIAMLCASSDARAVAVFASAALRSGLVVSSHVVFSNKSIATLRNQ